MRSRGETGDGVRKFVPWIEIRIEVAAAVPSPPTGVQGELH